MDASDIHAGEDRATDAGQDAMASRERRRHRIAVGAVGAVIAIACLLPHSERGLLPWDRPAAAFMATPTPRDGPSGWRMPSAGALAAASPRLHLPIVAAGTGARAFPATAVDYAADLEPVATPIADAAPLPLAALAAAPAAAGYFAIGPVALPAPPGSSIATFRGGGGGGGGGGVPGTGSADDGTATAPRPGGDVVGSPDPVATPLAGDDVVAPPSGGEAAVTPQPGGDVPTPSTADRGETPATDPVPPPTIVDDHAGDPSPGSSLPTPPAPLPTSVVAGVPEPATWAMLIVGFAAVGGGLRRARRREAGVAA